MGIHNQHAMIWDILGIALIVGIVGGYFWLTRKPNDGSGGGRDDHEYNS